jgi:HSP20 family protein
MIFSPVIRRAAFSHTPRSADQALQRFLMGTLAEPSVARSAAGCTVTQDDKATTLQLDVPGLAREQLQISIEGNVVRLQSVEGAPRQVQRAWELAADIDAANSSAKLENGVLTLVLGQVAPQSRAVALPIQ